jgi:hypothetical protein
LINPYLQALLLALLVMILLVSFSAIRLPKRYKPAEIPFQYLP